MSVPQSVNEFWNRAFRLAYHYNDWREYTYDPSYYILSFGISSEAGSQEAWSYDIDEVQSE